MEDETAKVGTDKDTYDDVSVVVHGEPARFLLVNTDPLGLCPICTAALGQRGEGGKHTA